MTTENSEQSLHSTEEKDEITTGAFVGVISLYKLKKKHSFEWFNALLPLSFSTTLLHRAIAECAYFGCDSIWITCEYEEQALYKRVITRYINDPLHYYFRLDPRWYDKIKRIPIYFVPMNPKDIGVRDSHAWGYINAAQQALNVYKLISDKVPRFFYAAPIEGIYSAELLSKEIGRAHV